MANVIGLDLGTTTVTGVLLDTEQGQIHGLAQRRNDATVEATLPTRAEQDPRRLRQLALDVLAELAGSPRAIDGLALTGQKHGLLCIDAHGDPLTPLISWQDQRTAEPAAAATVLDQLHARLSDLDWRENGCPIQHGYGAATLFWLVQQSQLPPATHRVSTIACWLAGQLIGCLPVTDPTFAASWGVYNLVDDAWNAAFLDRLGLDERLFPPVRLSGAHLGGLVPELAQAAGLSGGIPVFNALGDTQASFLGSVADPEHAVLFNLGTGGQICWAVPDFEPPSEQVETRPLPWGRFLRVGSSLCGGAAYAWLNHTVRAWLVEFGVDVDEETVYKRLNALAMAAKDAYRLRVRTTFLGVRGNSDVKAGAVEGITLDNLRLGSLARATATGIVDELRDLYTDHHSEHVEHTLIVAAGGGVRKNPLMASLIEEHFGLPVETPSQRETAAVGAAMLVDHLA